MAHRPEPTQKAAPAPQVRAPLFHPKILTTLRTYDGTTFVADMLAGLSVAMVAVPLAMAIAIASGARPEAGLVTAVIAGLIVSLLGGSKVQIAGPTGAFIVVVAGVIATHGYDGLLTATFMAGLILLAAGLTRMGGLIRYIPEPVINGFTLGIALIIAFSQLADALGLPAGTLPAEFLAKLEALWGARALVSPAAIGITVLTIALIVLFRRLLPRWPGLIIAVLAASGLAMLLGLDIDTLGGRFGTLQVGLPAPALPDLSLPRLVALFPSALVIAFLAGVESLLSAIVADRMSGNAHRSNTEVLAQGVANLASALMSGLPATGAIARTATNIRAGGKTPVSGIVHALFVLLFLLLLAPYAGFLAMPALAGVLLVTAWNMAELDRLAARFAAPRADLVLFVLTFALTVLVDLSVAIGTGVALGLALRLRDRRPGPGQPWTPRKR